MITAFLKLIQWGLETAKLIKILTNESNNMKFKLKKYLYLVNDVTNTLLNKERLYDKEIAHKLRVALIIASILLLLSVLLNIYQVVT